MKNSFESTILRINLPNVPPGSIGSVEEAKQGQREVSQGRGHQGSELARGRQNSRKSSMQKHKQEK